MLSKMVNFAHSVLYMVEHKNMLLVLYQNLKVVTLFYLLEPSLKFSIDMDFSAQFGKNVTPDDVKHLNQHEYDGYPDLITFFALVKSDGILRLLKFDLQNEYVLKAVEKTKVQRAGTFSQLLPATFKVSLHAVFKLEPNLINMKPTLLSHKQYLITFSTDDNITLVIKSMSLEQKNLTQVNTFTLPAPIEKVDVSSNYPFYISVVDKKKKVFLSHQDQFLH
jgi:hypothetical protein